MPSPSRAEALAVGERLYFGKTCRTCLGQVRYASNKKCFTCHKAREQARYSPTLHNPSKARQYRLKSVYGLTPAEFDNMVQAQESGCSICNQRPDVFHIDHSHETGQVRSLLCGPCNQAIGLLKEDPVRIRRAAEYIERHHAPRITSRQAEAA